MWSRVGKGARARAGRAPRVWPARSDTRPVIWLAAIVMAGGAALAHVEPAAAQSAARPVQSEDAPVQHLTVTLFKSRTLRVDRPFATAVVGSPDIADVLPMSDRSLYVQGKKVGTTNISVFDESRRLITVIDMEVAVDT